MGTQYRVEGAKIKRYHGDRGDIRVECFNATTRSAGKSYEQLLKEGTDYFPPGDVIIEVVGVVKERPKMEKHIVPFVVGDQLRSTNGCWWKLVGILPDRLVWANDNDSGPSLFTMTDGKPWKDGYTGFKPKIEEVQVGTEKYIDKENV